MLTVILLLVWVLGIAITYHKVLKDRDSQFERIWLSVVWPVLIPLYIVHWIYNHI